MTTYRDVQYFLNQYGFTDLHGNKLVEDNKKGPLTVSAIKKFQLKAQELGIYPSNYLIDGIPCPATLKAITLYPNTPKPTPIKVGPIQAKIQNGTGKTFSTFTDFYNIVLKYCHYGYYFNNQKTLDQEIQSVIDSINGVNQGLEDEDNCVDWAELAAALGKEKGYTVIVYGIYCTGDKIWHAIALFQGHEFKNPTWIDLAAASKSNYPIGSHWCSGQLVKEPSWIPYETS
jgi:hypothetical protein